MPEYRNHPNPTYQNERVRGTGGLGVTSFGEENLLNLAARPLRRREHRASTSSATPSTPPCGRIDPAWRKRLGADLPQRHRQGAVEVRLRRLATRANTGPRSASRTSTATASTTGTTTPIATREQLKLYDPEGYELVRTTFKLTPENDWRYRPLRRQPSVMPPPAKFKIDPYYTKFTCAREFPVLGSKHVSDEALLKANDTIRKMFAYRHDILKAMIADGARLVVLGRSEKLSDLPEFKDAKDKAGFDEVRYLDYTPELKLMVVPEENVLGLPSEPFAGECMVVSVFAKGLYQVTGLRPVDPELRPAARQAAIRAAREAPGRRVRQAAARSSTTTRRARACGRARRRRATGSSTGRRAWRPTSTPPAPACRPTAPTGRSPPARRSRRTTRTCTRWSMRRWPTRATSIGDSSRALRDLGGVRK